MPDVKVKALEACMWVESLDLFTLRFVDEAGEQVMVNMPLGTAPDVALRVAEALQQIDKRSRPPAALASPEKVGRYASTRQADGSVVLMIEGNRSNPLRWHLAPGDAKRLAALLLGSSEPQTRKPAN